MAKDLRVDTQSLQHPLADSEPGDSAYRFETIRDASIVSELQALLHDLRSRVAAAHVDESLVRAPGNGRGSTYVHRSHDRVVANRSADAGGT